MSSNAEADAARLEGRAEEITRIVLRVIKEEAEKKPTPGRVASILKFAFTKQALFLVALVMAGIAWLGFGVSPLLRLEEESARQTEVRRAAREHEFKRTAVKHHLRDGDEFLGLGEASLAAGEFEAALKLDPINVDAEIGLLKSRLYAYIEGPDYNSAVAEKRLESLQAQRPDDPFVALLQGTLSWRFGHMGNAEERWRFAAQQRIPAGYASLAQLYDLRGNRDEAIKMYLLAIEQSKWNQMFRNNLGYVYYQQGDYRKAMEQYDAVIRLDDRILLTRFMLARSLEQLGDLEAAHAQWREALKRISNKDALAWRQNRGIWYFHSAEDSIVVLDTDSMKKAFASYGMALALCLLGRGDEAIGHIRTAQRLAGDERTSLELLIEEHGQLLSRRSLAAKSATEHFRRLLLRVLPERGRH